MGNRRINQQGRLSLRKIILGFFLLLIIFVGFPYYLSRKGAPETDREKGSLIPSEVLNSKSKYVGKKIAIRGKVSTAPVVCQQKDCPVDDPCCGCPDERNLFIVDPGVFLASRTKQQLKLLDGYSHQSFCQRYPSSCEYDCQDWVKGAIYDVQGIFFAEPPPLGWQYSLEQYLEVEDNYLVRKASSQEVFENLFEEIKDILGPLGRPSSYVID